LRFGLRAQSRLIAVALDGVTPEPMERKVGRFTVIDRGALLPYRVILAVAGGQKTERTRISFGPTPKIGDTIFVDVIGNGTAKAQVTGVRRNPDIDEVDAQEW
jgi:hypothetical protein